jgi:putative heme transporter
MARPTPRGSRRPCRAKPHDRNHYPLRGSSNREVKGSRSGTVELVADLGRFASRAFETAASGYRTNVISDVGPPSDADGLPRNAVVVPASGIGVAFAWVVATLIALIVVTKAGQVIELLLAAVVVAALAAPCVRTLARKMPRALALVIVTLSGVVFTTAGLVLLGRDVDRQAGHLVSALHDAIARWPAGGTAARLASDSRLDDRLHRLVDAASSRLPMRASDPLAGVAQVAEVVVVAVLAAFIITSGEQVLRQLITLVRRSSTREQLHVAASSSLTRAGSFLRRTLAVSALHGAAAGLVCLALGLPGSVTLGTWVGVMSTVPIVGAVLAWAPIIALTSVDGQSWRLALVAGVVCIVIDRVMRHRWVHSALRVGPLLTLLGLGVGLSVAGVPGAVIGLFVVAVAYGAASPAAGQPGTIAMHLIEDDGRLDAHVAGRPSAATEPVLGERTAGRQLVVRLSLSSRSLATMSAILVTAWIVIRIAGPSQPLLIWSTVGAFIAAGLDRPISGLERRLGLPRSMSILSILALVVCVVAAIVALAGPSIVRSSRSTASDAPQTVASMETLPVVGHLLRDSDASKQVADYLADLPHRVATSGAVERLSHAAGDWISEALWIIAATLALLLDGPRLVRSGRDRVPARRRRQAVRFGRAAYTAFSNVVAAAAFIAALNGTVVMVTALVLGIPLAIVLGVWAALWNFIPQIGGFVGGLPLVALGFAQGPWIGVIAAVCFITYQAFENHVLQPVVGSRVVQVPPLVMLVGVMFGGALAGFVGALMAGPLIGVAKVALDQLRPSDRHRIEDRDVIATTPSFASAPEPATIVSLVGEP